jgi:DDE superfamily endonuclease
MRLFAPPVADAYATARPAATRYLIFVTPDNQALDRSQPVLPMMPGMPEKRTHDYVRHGTVDLFAAFDVATGLVIAKTYKCHRSQEWIEFLEEIDKQVPLLAESGEPGGGPHALQIHIVADNYATHKTPAVQQ